MKQLKKVTLLLALSIILTACNNETSRSDVTSSPTTSDSSSTSDVQPKVSWSNEAKQTMLDYLGEVLPYPEGFVGEVSVNEYGSDDNTYLSIIDEGKF